MNLLAAAILFLVTVNTASAQQRPAAAVPPNLKHAPHPSVPRKNVTRLRVVYIPYAYSPDQPLPPQMPQQLTSQINPQLATEYVEQPRDPQYDPSAAQPAEDYTPRTVQAPAPTPQDWAMSEGHYYLIAAKDHSIYTALAFWMEAGALHYVTPTNAHNQITPDLLDLELTKKLNANRGLAFNLVR